MAQDLFTYDKGFQGAPDRETEEFVFYLCAFLLFFFIAVPCLFLIL